MGLLPDYSRQAIAYDFTRGASPSVLSPLRRALDGAPGQRLLDVGGGTGSASTPTSSRRASNAWRGGSRQATALLGRAERR